MRSRRWWAVPALAAAIGGSLASFATATNIAADERKDARKGFQTAAAEVTANVLSQVEHINDLTVNAQAFVRRNPELGTRDLRAWADEVQVFQRYPALLSLSAVVLVDQKDLPAHIARVTADPPDHREDGQPFHIEPATPSSAYCLVSAAVSRPAVRRPLGWNACPGVPANVINLMKTMDSPIIIPATYDGQTFLAMDLPLYRTPEVPPMEARASQFVAHFGIAMDATAMLRDAVKNHRGFVASLSFVDTSKKLLSAFSGGSFRTGRLPAHAQLRRIDVGGGWTVTVGNSMPPFGIGASKNARQLLIGGVAMSLLVGLLLWVLATGRFRALRMVAEKTDELRHQALHDPLTGLANRALLNDRVEQLLARSRRSGIQPSCLYLDLDGFKNVNDTLGHEAGDLLLTAVASRLRGAVREADTIARMGGDEFVVLLDGAILEAAPELVAERLLEVLRQPFEVQGVEAVMRLTTSIGIATGDRGHGDDLVRDADLALYEAKAAGRNRVVVFREDMQAAIQHGIELEFDLRMALEREQFRLMYQPIYNLDDLSVVGFEALLRWEHPTLGLVGPNEFIPILERTGQIVEVGEWVIREASHQLAIWRRQGSDATVSVNVASPQFDTGLLVGQVRRALADAQLDGSALTIEITESSLMRSLQVCVEQLSELREMGVQIAIDDFGTGYSSLASLQRLPVDSLKIDRSFIAAMGDTPEARALVRTIVQLGRDLGLKTLAEGVETTAQVDDLRGDHIDEAQGFLLARPLDPKTIERTILPISLGVPSEPNLG
jgi:diguanylate cyclase (GGDEF)-like protein